MAIVQTGKLTSYDVKDFIGVETIDKKEDLITKKIVTENNLGSSYMELSNNPDGGVKALYTLNKDSFGVLFWYKM